MNNIDLLIILTSAFLGSVGHCIGMCGGIVVAYTSGKIDTNTSWQYQSVAHLSYNLGRVTTYTLLGALAGLLGKAFAFTPETKGILFALTGVLMILSGISLLGNGKFLNSAEWSFSKYRWFQNAFRYLMREKSLGSFYLLGILNGLIPCGLVYSFAIIAASTATPLWGAIVMAVFGLSTVPALFFLGNITRFLQQGALRGTMMKIAALLVVLYGVMTLVKGYKFIAHPQKMQQMLEKMHAKPIEKNDISSKCGGRMKCAPGKCG